MWVWLYVSDVIICVIYVDSIIRYNVINLKTISICSHNPQSSCLCVKNCDN